MFKKIRCGALVFYRNFKAREQDGFSAAGMGEVPAAGTHPGSGGPPSGGGATAGSKNKGEKVKTFLNYPEAPLPRDIRPSAKQTQASTGATRPPPPALGEGTD